MTEFEDWLANKNARRSRKNEPKSSTRGFTHKTRRSPRKRRKTGFSTEVREAAAERADYRCENPLCKRDLPDLGGEHHCIPRSQYAGADRNDLWNCAHICYSCHDRITAPRTRESIRLRRYFERIAYVRRTYSESRARRESLLLEKELRDQTLSLDPVPRNLFGKQMHQF